MRRRLLPLLGLALSGLLAAPPALRYPKRWVHGAPGEPLLQVHEAAPGTWILRQSKRATFEAPFLYLLAGRDRALLLDTGAKPAEGSATLVRDAVDDLLRAWFKGRGGALVVAHSHAHGDHTGGDATFVGRPNTEILPLPPEALARALHLDRWPEGETELDLGGRRLRILPLPGHEPSHLAIYDETTQALFTGDTLYPGLLTIRDWPAFRASAARLAAFARTHPVRAVLGAHVEMTRHAGRMYPLGTPFQPEEHALALGAADVAALDRLCRGLGDFRHRVDGAAFRLERVLGPSGDAPSQHGMLAFGTERLYLSHLPMFHTPHDYQLLAEASLDADAMAVYRADRRRSGARLYTLAPSERWALPDRMQANATFEADLYRGHFERGGVPILMGVRITVKQVLHARRFEAGQTPDPGAWIAFGEGAERFFAHRLEGAPDMDQIVRVDGPAVLDILLRLPVRGPLRAGQRIGAHRVREVIYTEFDDLKQGLTR